MRVRITDIRHHRNHRGAAKVPAILIPLILVVGVGAGIFIGTGIDKKESPAGTNVAINTTSGVDTKSNVTNVSNVPANINAGDEIDPAIEAKMDAARVAMDRANRATGDSANANAFDEDEVVLEHDHSSLELSTPPPVAFEPAELDFGIVPPGQHITGTVQIHNTGTEPITIEASRASCTCTAVDMSNVTIEPGESAPMDATFTQATLGEKNASVRLKIKGYSSVLEVPIKATVALAVLSEPAYIQASAPRTSSIAATHGEIIIRSIDEKPFNILAIDGKPPVYVDYDSQFDQPRNTYTVRWSTSDINPRTCTDVNGNTLHRWWVVETDHPDCPVFDIQVRHSCTLPEPRETRNWIVSPPRILVGELSPGETIEVEGTLKWVPRAPHNEQLHAALSESSKITVELVKFIPNTDEDRFILRIRVSENAPEGMLYETIRLHSDLHKAPLLITGRIGK